MGARFWTGHRSDVLIEFPPRTLGKMGLDFNTLQAAPVVYCSVSGFGQTGPRSHQPGYDAVMRGEGGDEHHRTR